MEVALFADAYRRWGHLTVQPVVAARAAAEPFDNRKGVTLNATRLWVPGQRPPQTDTPSACAGIRWRTA